MPAGFLLPKIDSCVLRKGHQRKRRTEIASSRVKHSRTFTNISSNIVKVRIANPVAEKQIGFRQ